MQLQRKGCCEGPTADAVAVTFIYNVIVKGGETDDTR